MGARHVSTRRALSLLLSLLLLGFDAQTSCASARSIQTTPAKTSNKFIETSCSGTAHPRLCLTSLSPHANKIQTNQAQLVQTALSVSLDAAQAALDSVSKLSVSDCMATMEDSVAQLKRSVEAMVRFGLKRAKRHVNNAQTWASAAMTEQYACMEALPAAADKEAAGSGGSTVRVQLMKSAQLTSNALSLVGGLAAGVSAKHKP